MHKSAKEWNLKRSIIFTVISAAAVFTALLFGRYNVSVKDTVSILFSGILNNETSKTAQNVITGIRLPRILAALLCGGGLAMAGAGFQAVFSNPLAAPDTLGVATAASFGAVLAILAGMPAAVIQTSAMLMGMLVIIMVYAFSKIIRSDSAITIILSGMVSSSFFSAMTTLVKYIADPQDKLPAITYWLLGNLKNITWGNLAGGSIFIIAGIIIIAGLRWRLDVLSLSEEEAVSFGIKVKFLRAVVITACSAITAAVVSMCGQIGWVGLLVPHLCRMIYGHGNKNVIPASFFYGGLFLLICDTFGRSISSAEIPVSIITAAAGAPVFMLLLKRTGGIGG